MRKQIKPTSYELEEKIRAGSPIQLLGLTFYPILMKQYGQYLACRDAIILRLSTLPVRYLSLDYLSAIWALELDTIADKKKSAGLFIRALHFLTLALRIDDVYEKALPEHIVLRKENGKILIDHIVVKQDGNVVNISPRQFSSEIRPLLAQMNALELPDESENVDLVKAYEEKRQFEARDDNLKFSLDDLIASVAYLSGVRERDICEWTVREFEMRQRAIGRDKRYTMYGQAELTGFVTFPRGNPAPSWCFDREETDELGTRSMSDVGKAFGAGLQNGAKPSNIQQTASFAPDNP